MVVCRFYECVLVVCRQIMNLQCTHNKLRTEQSTDFKLYIGSDEQVVVFAQYVQVYLLYILTFCTYIIYLEQLQLATVSHC